MRVASRSQAYLVYRHSARFPATRDPAGQSDLGTKSEACSPDGCWLCGLQGAAELME